MQDWKGILVDAEGTGVSPHFSKHVNLLGSLLGHSIREQLGDDIFHKVEELRRLCKSAYQPGKEQHREDALALIRSLTNDEILWLLRSFTAFFRLVNNAEKHEIFRVNHERERAASTDEPRTESIADAIHRFKVAGFSLEDVMKKLAQLNIEPTLTAHPTEARRRTILYKLQDIAVLLEELQRVDQTPAETELTIETLYQQISIMLATDEVRAESMSVIDEVQNGMYFFESSIWETVPQIYADIERALRLNYGESATEKFYETVPTILKYRSWIGGDRDGNPYVTKEVTKKTLQIQRITAMQQYLRELRKLRREVSVSSRLTKIPDALVESLKKDATQFQLDEISLRQFSNEPLRLKVRYMGEKIDALIKAEQHSGEKPVAYSAADFLDDLELLADSLKKMGIGNAAAATHLNRIIMQARTFGFHLAAIDIRQHSNVHEAAVADLLRIAGVAEKYESLSEAERLEVLSRELKNPRPLAPYWATIAENTENVLSTMQMIRDAKLQDPNTIGCYIISMTHDVSDLLEVLLLAKEAGMWHYANGKVQTDLDVVPLLETIEDLRDGSDLLDAIFSHPVYRDQLAARGNFQEIMLGYSDSNKDGGYWMANWALYQAQRDFAAVCRKHNIGFRYFHGRGGTVGRGGGRANQAILAMPRNSYTGQIRFTEQGEVISFRYALPYIARRHLEQIVNAMLQSALQSEESLPLSVPLNDAYQTMEKLATSAMAAYQQLIYHPKFWKWYISVTPIEHISRLKIASRPVSRKAADQVDFEGLRAIPWVFAWTQTRFNIPGWYGTGFALSELTDDADMLNILQTIYREWPFFRTVVDNVQLEIARTHLTISKYYDQLSGESFLEKITEDFENASTAICKITGQKEVFDNAPTIKKSIALRNPYTDVLNLLQIDLLKRLRSMPEAERDSLALAMFLSINGIAAAMQSTG